MDRPLWHKREETFSAQELAELQLTKLRKQLKYVYDHSLYFRRRLDEAGVNPQRVQSLDDLAQIPLFTKDEHRKAQEASLQEQGHPYGLHLCASLRKVVCISATSGTTGLPTFYTFTRKDLQVR